MSTIVAAAAGKWGKTGISLTSLDVSLWHFVYLLLVRLTGLHNIIFPPWCTCYVVSLFLLGNCRLQTLIYYDTCRSASNHMLSYDMTSGGCYQLGFLPTQLWEGVSYCCILKAQLHISSAISTGLVLHKRRSTTRPSTIQESRLCTCYLLVHLRMHSTVCRLLLVETSSELMSCHTKGLIHSDFGCNKPPIFGIIWDDSQTCT